MKLCATKRCWLPIVLVAAMACTAHRLLAASAVGSATGSRYASYFGEVSRAILKLPLSPDIQPLPSGDYRIFYKDPEGRRRSWVFIPASKARGKVAVEVYENTQARTYTYRYRLQVDPAGPSSVRWFCVGTADAKPSAVTSPVGGAFLGKSPLAPALCWVFDKPGLPPGGTATVSFTSTYPPAAGTFYLRGISPAPVANPPGTGEWMYDPRPTNMFEDSAVGDTIGPLGDPAAQPYAGAWVPVAGHLPAGWRVLWDAAARRAIARPAAGRGEVRVEAGNAVAQVDGRPVVLAAPARMVEGRIAVPETDLSRLFPAGGR